MLIFGFNADGTVRMADANTKPNDPRTFIQGHYTQNGNQVEIRFSNCVYRGQINGQVMTGVGQVQTAAPGTSASRSFRRNRASRGNRANRTVQAQNASEGF